jgi:glutamyl-tRNA synthetase
MSVRVRFAPSPTGPLHIGGVRTALFNYLFAKKHGGTFYLRIEDTDQTRFVPGAEAYIMEALQWLGIAPDETVGKNEKYGPYRQSERKEIYQQYIQKLIQKGWAYYAFDTPEALDALRKEAEANGQTFMYGWHNRMQLNTSLNCTEQELQEKLAQGLPYVVRFKIPENQTLVFHDIIRGEIKVETNTLDDKVLFKSDGMPTYHLANIVDDHLMETTHVIRGEEWLPSLALHVLLYRAFDWKAPEFAHLPLILKPIGNGKLSKRDGDKYGFPVFPLEWKTEEGTSMGYREQGYLPEAVINFLALLGWNDGTDQELFTLEELVQKFDLHRVHKAGAKFDPEKNKWFNHQYLQQKTPESLLEAFVKELQKHQITHSYSNAQLAQIIGLLKERAYFVQDLWELSQYFFMTPTTYDEKAKAKWTEETKQILQQFHDWLQTAVFTSVEQLEHDTKQWLTDQNIGLGKLMPALRLSLVGALQGPHLFDIAFLLGKPQVLQRIQQAIA